MRLIESLATTEQFAQVFSDLNVLRAMLDFEVGLARAEARCGVIPSAAAEVIAAGARTEHFSIEQLASAALRAGTPSIPLVRMLTALVPSAAAGFVHWGATSQDVADTALVLLLKQCRVILERDHARLLAALHRLSEDHSKTVMLGRTLLQPAPPITFGLKAAGWYAAVKRGWARAASRFDETMYVQFGGAVGTLASLGDQGVAVGDALADELGLKFPDAPWHGHRDRLAALLAALSIYTGTLGKIAMDVALLMQFEVGEAFEPGGTGRGGSSTMPHKRNPTACMMTVAAARRSPGLLANFLSGMLQEHERAVGGWQAEWPAVEGILKAAGLAVESMVEVAEGLTVDVERMRHNIESTNGAVFAERAMMMLAPQLGRAGAHSHVEEAIRKTGAPPDLPGLRDPHQYLGSAAAFRLRLLEGGED